MPFADALSTKECHNSNFYHIEGEFEPWNDIVVGVFNCDLEDQEEREHHCSGSRPKEHEDPGADDACFLRRCCEGSIARLWWLLFLFGREGEECDVVGY